MSSNRTTLIAVGAILILCLCVAVISITAGGYLLFNQSSSSSILGSVRAAPTGALPTAPSLAIPPSSPTCDDVQEYDDLGYDHIRPGQTHPPYNSNPPTSGWHWADPQEWGIYSSPQVQEQLVHNLEHGGIVIQYNNLQGADLQRLIDFVRSNPRHVIVAPYPGLGQNVRVALTAWTYLQTCNGVDLDAIDDFIDEFRDQGPEYVP